jgi:hypothetical protein
MLSKSVERSFLPTMNPLVLGYTTTSYAFSGRQVMVLVTLLLQIPKLFCRGDKTFRKFVLGNVFSELVGKAKVGF